MDGAASSRGPAPVDRNPAGRPLHLPHGRCAVPSTGRRQHGRALLGSLSMTNSNRILDRVGAVAGVATVALFVATIAATPSVPSPNHGLATITRSLDNDLAG